MGMRIFQIPDGLSTLFPRWLWRKTESTSTSPILYLTFDDGPDPDVTLQILDILKNFNAQATFFVVGENALKHPDVICKIKELGHSIGNHTQNHIKGWNANSELYLENVQQCTEVLSNLNIRTALFRPPYGRIKPSQSKRLRERGHVICMWDILTYDYDKSLNIAYAIDKIETLARPGSLVVFHDSQKSKNQTLQMLPELLERWSGKFNFKALAENV